MENIKFFFIYLQYDVIHMVLYNNNNNNTIYYGEHLKSTIKENNILLTYDVIMKILQGK